jgi:hypothetical protein
MGGQSYAHILGASRMTKLRLDTKVDTFWLDARIYLNAPTYPNVT